MKVSVLTVVGTGGKLVSIEDWGPLELGNEGGYFEGADNLAYVPNHFNLSGTTNLKNMFKDASRLGVNTSLDFSGWNTSEVTDMSNMFYLTRLFNKPLNTWDVGKVTNMSGMFRRSTIFNQPLDNWSTNNVTDMSEMFNNAIGFNQNLSNWSTSNVTDMSGMFTSTYAFNQNISGWDTSGVSDMSSMFLYSGFNQPLNNWDVSKVSDMSSMFSYASFNQNLSNWSTSNVTDMSSMFQFADSFNQPIGTWNVSNVVNMANMFEGASVFNQNLSNWNTSKVKSMRGMFSSAYVFNQNITGWDVSNVNDMSSMFSGASVFNQDIGGWDVSSVNDMASMFLYTNVFNQDIGSWNTSSVTDMSSMFFVAQSFDQDISNWNVCKVSSFTLFDSLTSSSWESDEKPEFAGCVVSVTTANPDGVYNITAVIDILVEFNVAVLVSGFPTLELAFDNANKTASYYGGSGTNTLTFKYVVGKDDFSSDLNYSSRDALKLNGGSISSSSRPRMSLKLPVPEQSLAAVKDVAVQGINPEISMFVSVWNTSKTTAGSSNNKQITLPLRSSGEYNFTVYWSDEGATSHITSHNQAEVTHTYAKPGTYEVYILGKIDGFGFGGSGDGSKLISIEDWGPLKLGNDGAYFSGASNLEYVPNHLNLTGTTDLSSMFESASSFGTDTELDISGWDTSMVTDMSYMFAYTTNFDSDISKWDVSKVTSMESMFDGASIFDSEISGWEVSNVTNMDFLFNDAPYFNHDLSKWKVCNVVNYDDFDSGATFWQAINKPMFGRACVLSVSSNNTNKIYGVGESIYVSVNFNEEVLASNSSYISLDFNEGAKNAYYLSGNSTKTLVFNYVVEKGDVSYDLNYVGGVEGGVSSSSTSQPVITSLPSGKHSLSSIKDISVYGYPSRFVSVWNTSKENSSKSVKLPLQELGVYNFSVDWGDGNVSTITSWNSTDSMHTYAQEGVQTIKIVGKIEGFGFNNTGDRNKLINITDWGTLELVNDGSYFYGTTNLESVPNDDSILTNITNLERMFF